jgi:tRNA(Ile)-lysidine synthase
VAALCDGLGIDHTTLAWEGVKPPSGLAEAARRARYALIEEFAIDIGADLILAGHTEDDQAETVWMRVMRGAGASLGRGLAGMGRTTLLPGGTLMARPLLGVSRARLRTYLAAFPQSWIEDPTNQDPTYERVRIRRQLAENPQLRRQLLDLNGVMGRWRALLSRDTAALLQHLVTVRPGPVLSFDLAVALAAPDPVLVHAVQVLLAVSGGAEHLAPRGRIEALIAGFSGGETGRMTLAGSVIERDGAGIRFYRELRNIDSCFVDPGETVVWDGRMEVTNGGKHRIHVGPLTRAGLVEIEQVRKAALAGRPRAALHSSAVIRTHDGRAFLPMLEADGQPAQVLTRLTARAVEHFCPQTDQPLIEWLRGIEVARRACLSPRQ